jgi:uncharacterized membrane protein
VAGILLVNIRVFPLDRELSNRFTEATVLLAIPMLLFSTDFLKWLKMAKATVISFGLTILSILVLSSAGSVLFSGRLAESNKVAGMLVGVYTGGTLNMSAIAVATGVDENTFLLVNGADVVLGALYFFFLLTVAKRILQRFFPPFRFPDDPETNDDEAGAPEEDTERPTLGSVVAAIAGSLLLCLAAVGLSLALTGKLSEPVIILSATSFGIACSFWPRIRNLRGSYDTGQYILLIFCVAIGTLADIQKIAQVGPTIFAYVSFVMVGAICLHYLLAWIFRIDVDTLIITSTAAIFGPPFVGPIVGFLKNKQVLVSGLTSGLIGIAIGNYLGIMLVWILS